MALVVSNRLDESRLPAELALAMENLARLALKDAGLPEEAEVSLTLCGDEDIQVINCQWRGIDAPTDVLSFPLLEDEQEWPGEGEEELLLGDIIISLERAQEQALEYNHTLERELLYLFTHGLLHLLGYNHEEEAGRREMRRREEDLLSRVGALR